jgi:nucleotide-binding universal stress UspA family protein
MTIIAGFSSSRQGAAPLNLAAQIARCTDDKIIAAVVVERPWPANPNPVEEEYLGYVASHAAQSLERVVGQMRDDVDVSVVVHHATSVPAGLMELVSIHDADLVAVGSSSSGLLGRVALGSVTERLVHTAAVPVAIAPRGYAYGPSPIRRLTAAYGGAAEATGLIATSAALCERWSLRLRIASFTVRPLTRFSGAIEPSAEDLVVRQWAHRTFDEVVKQLNEARACTTIPDVDVVVGGGHDWREAIEDVDWDSGDMLVLGSGSAGQAAQVFLGSAASKILRHVPVPAMIVPRHDTTS